MPQLYYDSNNQIRAPEDSDYDISSLDFAYHQYIDTLYYLGFCKNNGLPVDSRIRRKISHSKNMLMFKLSELESSVNFSMADALIEEFDSVQVGGWLKDFEKTVTPSGEVFLYEKQ
jgi:hypothetical protein